MEVLNDRWGATVIVSRGRPHNGADLPAQLAELEGHRVGLATYRIDGDEAEMVTLDALVEGRRAGTALLDAVVAQASYERSQSGLFRVPRERL